MTIYVIDRVPTVVDHVQRQRDESLGSDGPLLERSVNIYPAPQNKNRKVAKKHYFSLVLP